MGGAGYYVWQSPEMIADVQAWLDNPAANFGWLLRGNESAASTAKRFATREELEPTFRPLLHVEYVPEPATVMLALAAVAVLGAPRRAARAGRRPSSHLDQHARGVLDAVLDPLEK